MTSLDGQATWLVNRAHVRAHRHLRDAFDDAGSRPYYFRLLATLRESGAMSQADLGRATGLDRSDVTASIDALAQDGFVVRESDPEDRRRNRIRLTASGATEVRRLDLVLAQVQATFLAPLTETEQRQFLDLIGKLG